MPQSRFLAIGLLAALLAAGGAQAAKAPAAKPAAAKKAPSKAAQPKPVTAPAAATAAPPAPVDPNLITLETVSGMSEAGAPRLALEIMDRDQPDPAKDLAGWMSWERERIYIYQSSHAWKAVVRRMGKLPKDATPDFRAWVAMQAADAWLHLGDGAKALALVQPLIWDAKQPPDERDLAALRQLVIRSYNSLGRLDDAQTAVIRYRQDYPKDGGAWPLLEARLFLRLGQPQSALDVLQDVAGDEADMLALLASLRSGALSPGDALGQAVKIGSDSKAPEAEQVRAWIIAAEAADRLHNPVARISALQNALGLQDVLIEQDDVFVLTPDMLWDAYISYGEDLGNDLQLVVGDDQAWFVAASNKYDTAPIGAAALFSVVAYDAQGRANAAGGTEPEAARQAHMKESGVAHGQFAALLQRQRYGGVVLRHLYLDSTRFKDPPSVPAEVRYVLVDDVLAMPDIPLASQLLQGLDTAPPAAPGEKRDDAAAEMAWQLKRAHVFILGGDPSAGVASLRKLIEGDDAQGRASAAGSVARDGRMSGAASAPLDVEEVLQVLFDLQTLHRDKDAIPLFEALLARPLPPDQRRQMLYWTADSYKAVEDFPKAAELYLRSAMLPGPFTLDPWAQTARYQAAQMLGRAGYIEDARQLYQGLLNATRDPAQQAVLEHDLQQLMLLPAKPGGELH